MSTLVEELERAVTRARERAHECSSIAPEAMRASLDEVSGLLKRIEHVKRLRNEMPSKADIELFEALTGDL